MPKLLFSKIRIYEFKDLITNVKKNRRIDIIQNRNRCKEDRQCVLVQMRKDDTHTSKLKCQDKKQFQPSLERLLNDKECLAAFRAFLQYEFSEENIEFWLACKDFREKTSSGTLYWKAKEIYQEFLQPEARREVNVDHCIRENIRKSLENPSVWCFDEAQRHVYQLMERDSCPRFLRSEAYLTLRKNNLWYI